MMTRTHGMTGIAVWITGDTIARWAGSNHPYHVAIIGGLTAYYAAKAPDIDTPDSRPGRQISSLVPGLSSAVNAILGHRGATHWIATGLFNGAVTGGIMALVDPSWWWIGLAITVGWTSHILGDCCTYQGTPAYGPFTTRPVRLPARYLLRSGGETETTIVYPAAFAVTVATVLMSLAHVMLD